MTKTEMDIRLAMFEAGRKVELFALDENEAVTIGRELIAESGVCYACRGTGEDGDPPDANGEGGGVWACRKCGGSGFTDRVATVRQTTSEDEEPTPAWMWLAKEAGMRLWVVFLALVAAWTVGMLLAEAFIILRTGEFGPNVKAVADWISK